MKKIIFYFISLFFLTNYSHAQEAGFAVSLDGLNDYINMNNMNTGTAWTIEAWVKLGSNPMDHRRSIVGGFAEWRDWGFSLSSSGQLVAPVKRSDCTNNIVNTNSGFVPFVGEWVHVATTKSGGTAKLYVNGQLVGTRATCSSYVGGPGMAVGREFCCPGNNFHGLVDEVRVWGNARSEAQIRSRMYVQTSGLEGNLNTYYRFDEGSGNSTADLAPWQGFNSGFFNNGASWTASDAPVSSGNHAKASISTNGVYTFPDTDLTLNFNNISGTVDMEVSKLSGSPQGTQPIGSDSYSTNYWVVDKFNTGTFSDADFTFNIQDLISTVLSDYQLYKRESNSTGSWVQVALSASGVDLNNNIITFDGISCCSQYIVGFSSGALPLELIDFHARLIGHIVELKWSTSSEQNTSHFELEKSRDGYEWSVFAKVTASGENEEIQIYSAVDGSPAYGLNYYRLKQIDVDNKFAYAPTALVEMPVGSIHIFPNPTKDVITITGQNLEHSIIIISDGMGKIYPFKKRAQAKIDVSKLPSGIYYLAIKMKHQVISKRFLKS